MEANPQREHLFMLAAGGTEGARQRCTAERATTKSPALHRRYMWKVDTLAASEVTGPTGPSVMEGPHSWRQRLRGGH